MSKIITDLAFLRQKSTDVGSVAEAELIIGQLRDELKKDNNGIGLSAIQIGIPKRVSVIKKPDGDFLYIVNPVLVDQAEEFVFTNEGSLSIPNTFVNVKRWRQVVIKNQTIYQNGFREDLQYFYYDGELIDSRSFKVEAIAVQHALDHFDGILNIDRKIEVKQVFNTDKTSRNDPCPCGSGKKYKKCCLSVKENH